MERILGLLAMMTFIERAINDTMRTLGFTRACTYWYKDIGKTIVAINLERRGPLHLIAFGVFVKQFGKFNSPAVSEFHWGGTSGELNKKYHSRNKYFDLSDKTLSNEKKVKEIEKCLAKVIVPFLMQFDSVDALCGMDLDMRNRMLFPRKLWEYCESKWKKKSRNT